MRMRQRCQACARQRRSSGVPLFLCPAGGAAFQHASNAEILVGIEATRDDALRVLQPEMLIDTDDGKSRPVAGARSPAGLTIPAVSRTMMTRLTTSSCRPGIPGLTDSLPVTARGSRRSRTPARTIRSRRCGG